MATEPWGVKVERVEVKDVRVPAQLMRAMAAEAEAAREARAKVIAAEGEHKASRSLRQAAEVITDSPAALQVRTRLGRNTETNSCPARIVTLPPDPEQHLRGEQQHGGVPCPCGHLVQLHAVQSEPTDQHSTVSAESTPASGTSRYLESD